MNEAPNTHGLEPAVALGSMSQTDDAQIQQPRRTPLSWRIHVRCAFVSCVIVTVLAMTYRPSMMRLSAVMSLVSPTQGDSLAWRPEPEDEAVSPAVRYVPAPSEWRLAAAHTVRPDHPRAAGRREDNWRGGEFPVAAWGRLSYNPWSWADDVPFSGRRVPAPDSVPMQKPESSFRTRDNPAWAALAGADRESTSPITIQPDTTESAASLPSESLFGVDASPFAPLALMPTVIAETTTPTATEQFFTTRPPEPVATQPEPTLSISPADGEPFSAPPPLAIPALPETPAADRGREFNVFQLPPLPSTMTTETPVVSEPNIEAAVIATLPTSTPTESVVIDATPADLPDSIGALWREFATAAPTTPELQTATPASTEAYVEPVIETVIETSPIVPFLVTAEPDSKSTELQPPSAETPAVETAVATTAVPEPEATSDWLNREITAPIPGAYLTIYPKLKFIGLCVPGEGYIRKYNQVAVPAELEQAKYHAADGSVPYGKYYIARHDRGAAGPELVLSWPSPDDAQRVGLGPEVLEEVDKAWQNQVLPPQDSHAGGGVTLSGDRHLRDVTTGGFALEEPHMEEIFTALPDGAWVFIQR